MSKKRQTEVVKHLTEKSAVRRQSEPSPGQPASRSVELRKTFQFEAAHLLPHLPKFHKCRRLHGHSFTVEIAVAGECDHKLGWLMDYAGISKPFKPLWEKLDHSYLNEIPGLENPTSEIIAMWIWKRLKPKLPLLTEVVVAETCTARCVYRGP